MPLKIVRHRCAVCGHEYEQAAEAVACETQAPPPSWPVGMLFRLARDPSPDATFALASSTVRGHRVIAWWYVAGLDPTKDLLPPKTGAGAYMREALPPDAAKAHFGRMVAALRKNGITPSMWTGTEAVPLPLDQEKLEV